MLDLDGRIELQGVLRPEDLATAVMKIAHDSNRYGRYVPVLRIRSASRLWSSGLVEGLPVVQFRHPGSKSDREHLPSRYSLDDVFHTAHGTDPCRR
jgi:hypothetical protein